VKFKDKSYHKLAELKNILRKDTWEALIDEIYEKLKDKQITIVVGD